MAQLHLIFGFLGSGKTTLVRHLLNTVDSDKKTAVIVNEFGQLGFDGDAITEGQNVDLIELSSGCICCTLKGSLLNAAEELVNDIGAERIIVEASGVADPDDMLDDFEDPEVADNFQIAPLVTVVDTNNFNKLQTMLGDYYESQLANADILIMNKIDLAERDTINDATQEVREINPDALLYYTDRGDTDPKNVLLNTDYCSMRSDNGFKHHSHEHHHHHNHDDNYDQHHHHDHTHHSHLGMMSFIVDPNPEFSRQNFTAYCNKLPDSLFRMKGHMKIDGYPAQVQYAAGQLEIRDAEPRKHYRMVVIGRDLDAQSIAKGFGKVIAIENDKSG